MPKKGRNRILYEVESMAGRIRNLFAGSVLLKFASEATMMIEQRFRKGNFRLLSDAEDGHGAWQYRLRRVALKNWEESFFLRLFRHITRQVLSTSVSSFGFLGLFFCVFSALFAFFLPQYFKSYTDLFSVAFLSVVSLPLLSANHSLSFAILHSWFANQFLFGFCAVSEDTFRAPVLGKKRYVAMLFWAFLLALSTRFLSMTTALLCVLFIILGVLCFAVPELLTLFILWIVPFVRLFQNSGAILGGAVLLNTLAWLWKAMCGRRTLRFGTLDFSVLLLCLLFLCGGLFGAGGIDGLKNGAFMAVLLSFWFPAVNFFSQNIWKRRGLFALKSAGICSALWGIGQYLFSDLELLFVDTSRFSDIGRRVCGPFLNPNFFAEYLLLITPFFLATLLDPSQPVRSRCIHGIGLAIMLFALVFTWTRGAWLGILVAMLFLLISFSKTSFGILLLSLFPVGALIPFLPHSVIHRFLSIGSFSDSSVRYRLYTWRGVWRMVRAHIWGIGTGDTAFHRIYPQYAVSGTESVMHAHQLFLQIWVELGIPGLLLCLFLLCQILFFSAYGLKRFHGKERAFFLGALCGVIGVVVMGFFDDVWYHPGLFCLFFVVCAVLTRKGGAEYEEYSHF